METRHGTTAFASIPQTTPLRVVERILAPSQATRHAVVDAFERIIGFIETRDLFGTLGREFPPGLVIAHDLARPVPARLTGRTPSP